MSESREIDLLLVEDNPTDAELAIHALKKHNLGFYWLMTNRVSTE